MTCMLTDSICKTPIIQRRQWNRLKSIASSLSHKLTNGHNQELILSSDDCNSTITIIPKHRHRSKASSKANACVVDRLTPHTLLANNQITPLLSLVLKPPPAPIFLKWMKILGKGRTPFSNVQTSYQMMNHYAASGDLDKNRFPAFGKLRNEHRIWSPNLGELRYPTTNGNLFVNTSKNLSHLATPFFPIQKNLGKCFLATNVSKGCAAYANPHPSALPRFRLVSQCDTTLTYSKALG